MVYCIVLTVEVCGAKLCTNINVKLFRNIVTKYSHHETSYTKSVILDVVLIQFFGC